MEDMRSEAIVALQDLCSYNKKLIGGIDQVVEELRGNKQPDTDEYLAQIIKGAAWNIEALNRIIPILNEQEKVFDKEKINNNVLSFNEALQSNNEERTASALEDIIKPLLLELEQICNQLS